MLHALRWLHSASLTLRNRAARLWKTLQSQSVGNRIYLSSVEQDLLGRHANRGTFFSHQISTSHQPRPAEKNELTWHARVTALIP